MCMCLSVCLLCVVTCMRWPATLQRWTVGTERDDKVHCHCLFVCLFCLFDVIFVLFLPCYYRIHIWIPTPSVTRCRLSVYHTTACMGGGFAPAISRTCSKDTAEESRFVVLDAQTLPSYAAVCCCLLLLMLRHLLPLLLLLCCCCCCLHLPPISFSPYIRCVCAFVRLCVCACVRRRNVIVTADLDRSAPGTTCFCVTVSSVHTHPGARN